MTPLKQELEAIGHMTPAPKLDIMHTLIRQAYELKAGAIRARWPGMSELKVWARTRTLVGGDCP